jgi:hypothetical protein
MGDSVNTGASSGLQVAVHVAHVIRVWLAILQGLM